MEKNPKLVEMGLFQYFTFIVEEFWKFVTLNSSFTGRELSLKTSVIRID